MYFDATYALLLDEIRGPDGSLSEAREQLEIAFLPPEEQRRRQNAEAMKRFGAIGMRPG